MEDTINQEQENNIDNRNISVDLDSWDPISEAFYSPLNSFGYDEENPVAFYSGKELPLDNKMGDKIICDHYYKHGKCINKQACDKLHIPKRQRHKLLQLQTQLHSRSGRHRLNYTYLSPQLFDANPDKLRLVTLTNIITPDLFHFIVPFESYDYRASSNESIAFFMRKNSLDKSDVTRKLQKMSDELVDMFGTNRCDNIDDPIFPSQIVACRDPDGRFKRALVIDVPEFQDFTRLNIPNLDYKVYLLDTGFIGYYPREAIYDLKASCLGEPPMAVPGTLGLNPPAGLKTWPEPAIESFRKLALANNFMFCKIVEAEEDLNCPIPGYRVELFNLITRESLNDKIIQMGLAQK